MHANTINVSVQECRYGHVDSQSDAFAAACCQLAPRDRFVGWSADARLANIGLAVCNSRLLILTSVRVRVSGYRLGLLCEPRRTRSR